MLKTFALTCGYSCDAEIIYAEESIFLMRLDIPENVLDEDYYLWSVAELTLIDKLPNFGAIKNFKSSTGDIIAGKLFDKELRQITNVSFKLKETSSTIIPISKYRLRFQSKSDYLDYLSANEADNLDSLIDIKMSNFFPTSSTK